MKMLKEFKEFAVRGSVIDLAVGIIIGAAFGKIVNSLVNNILMPPIGWAMGGLDFSQFKIVIQQAVVVANGKPRPEVAIGYGQFLNAVIEFLIVAVAIFLLVKGINSLKRKQEAAAVPPPPSRQEELLSEIRDLLKNK